MSVVKYHIDNKLTGQSLEYDDYKHAYSEYRHMIAQAQLADGFNSEDILLYSHVSQEE